MCLQFTHSCTMATKRHSVVSLLCNFDCKICLRLSYFCNSLALLNRSNSSRHIIATLILQNVHVSLIFLQLSHCYTMATKRHSAAFATLPRLLLGLCFVRTRVLHLCNSAFSIAESQQQQPPYYCNFDYKMRMYLPYFYNSATFAQW